MLSRATMLEPITATAVLYALTHAPKLRHPAMVMRCLRRNRRVVRQVLREESAEPLINALNACLHVHWSTGLLLLIFGSWLALVL